MINDETQQELNWLRWHYYWTKAYLEYYDDKVPDDTFEERAINYYEGEWGNGNGWKVPEEYRVYKPTEVLVYGDEFL